MLIAMVAVGFECWRIPPPALKGRLDGHIHRERGMSSSLRDDAVAIWRAGVAAVDSERLVQQAVLRRSDGLEIAGEAYPLTPASRLVVVGGGKAGAGMAAGLEAALGNDWVDSRLEGWLNVPGDCVRSLQRIHLHPGRPAGINEPAAAGVDGVNAMLRLVVTMREDDLCIVLLSGGGSALLPAPVEGVTLADKQLVTRLLMERSAPIEDLNAVRGALSRFKQGGLARALPAGRAVALIISDVIGDPLAVIASGPTVTAPGTQDPKAILSRYVTCVDHVPERVWTALRERSHAPVVSPSVSVRNHIIGNNATALHAAASEARRRGYVMAGEALGVRGIARQIGCDLANQAAALASIKCLGRGWCFLSGGEPVVELVSYDGKRAGGRNQEVALGALASRWNADWRRIVIVSGGTDGEDGPTDAAGAIADEDVLRRAQAMGLDPQAFLEINNTYPFFAQTEGLLRTGPTHTNVMDVRVVLVAAE